ncbi:MAG TPA: hypothetical protein VHE34_22310 [Puia sp.]|uniref:hypothetical protein n=1 Tax=Puia sp. TaxID=2045100 RepID=UPI002B721F0A|nr:hypothetical protein [Puia sp.]HVU97981.1 hypothetical protein [Puia sp.]
MKLFISILVLILFQDCNPGPDREKEIQDSLHADSIAGYRPDPKGKADDKIIDGVMLYSVPLVVHRKDHPDSNYEATGFLVKLRDRMLLVSNYHVFMACDTRRKERIPGIYDSMGCTYLSATGAAQFQLNVRTLQKRHLPIYDFERADIWAEDVTALLKAKPPQFFLDSVALETVDTFTNRSLYLFGNVDDANPFTKFTLKQVNKPGDSSFQSYYSAGHHYVTNSYLASPATRGGASGSPVFFVRKDNNRPQFAGVVLGHSNVPFDVTMIVTPSEVRKEVLMALLRPTNH